MAGWKFSLFEVLAVLGLTHCVYALVYLFFRAGNLKQAIIVIGFFLTLALGFLANFANSYYSHFPSYVIASLFPWLSLPAVSALLVIQISRIETVPEAKYWLLLSFIPAILAFGWLLGSFQTGCSLSRICDIEIRITALQIAGIVFGGFSLLTLWAGRDDLMKVYQQKINGRERYWLIIALLGMNILFLCSLLLFVSGITERNETNFLMTIIGLALTYLASTSIFRLYPQAVALVPKKQISQILTSDAAPANELAQRLEALINLEKVYQDSTYSRSELARELGISEGNASKLVNQHFGKTVPQLLNEKRIGDACFLLETSDLTISKIAEEAGFSSLPSFNRVFKEVTGKSPSEYRKDSKNLPNV